MTAPVPLTLSHRPKTRFEYMPSSRPALRSLALSLLAAVGLVLALAWAAYGFAHDRAQAQVDTQGTTTLAFHAKELLGAVERFKDVPYLLGADPSLAHLLRAPDDPDRIASANRYLAFAQSRTSVFAAYLMDAQGKTLAASNWDQALSFVGKNYAFRPYFQDALAGRTGVFYGIGVTTGAPGAFLAAPIRSADQVIGVVAIKIDLGAFEATWRQSGQQLALADQYGIIFLSSNPSWRYRSLDPLTPRVLRELIKTRQYSDLVQQSLRTKPGPTPGVQGTLLRTEQQRFLVQGRALNQSDWRLLLFSDPRIAVEQGLVSATLAGLASALTLAGLGLAWQFRRRLAERLAARRELAQVVSSLEQRIAARTAELTAANETAVQAGKLALLGQMAAGVSHELSQPLAALRTIADNAAVFLARDDTVSAQENLRTIGELCGRMGGIVGELKAFARKEPARLQATPLAQVISSVHMLIEPHRRASGTRIETDAMALTVMADPIRLEQVLVNLVRNGIDAMEAQAHRRLDIRLAASPTQVTLSIRDYGPGLSPQVQAHLFEPFFTTKPSGKGLGLGLALSQAIVREMGASLSAANVEPGAQFDLTLQLAPTNE